MAVLRSWRVRAHLLRACCAAVAFGLLMEGSAGAQTTTDPRTEPLVKLVQNWATYDFTVDDKQALDEALRQRAKVLAQAHRERLAAMAAQWAAEEIQLAPADVSLRDLQDRQLAHYLNEYALWQLDTTGPAYDALMLRALQNPATCEGAGNHTAFPNLLHALQQLPPAEREQALAAQETLLARWGTPRQVPARPAPGVQEEAEAALRRARQPQAAPPEPPLPPRLAWAMLRATPKTLDASGRCLLARWWLLHQRAIGAPEPAQVVLRYALLSDAIERLHTDDKRDALTAEGYPLPAARHGVEGVVTVQAQATGSGDDAPRVVSRQLTVPGIRGVRPVAFETLLDKASVDRARKARPANAPADKAYTLEFNWKLQ